MHVDSLVTLHPRNTFLPNTVICLASHPRRHTVQNHHHQHLRSHVAHWAIGFSYSCVVPCPDSHWPGFNARPICVQFVVYTLSLLQISALALRSSPVHSAHLFLTTVVQGGSNMTGTDLCVNKLHCAAALRPWESEATTSTLPSARVRTCSVLSGSC